MTDGRATAGDPRRAASTGARTTRALLAIHRWCGLVVSLNFVVLALTGLVLVFHDEIDDALGVVPAVTVQGDAISLARAVEVAREKSPSATATYVFQRPDENPGVVFVGLAEGSSRLRDSKAVAVDRHAARVLEHVDFERTFSRWVLELHAELFAGLPGRLFVGALALAIVVSLVTGAIVYGPTMRRLRFGELRREGSRRLVLADAHKLVGAATFGWNLVVAATGALLSVSTLLFQLYASTELAARGARFSGDAAVAETSTLDEAVASAARAAPHTTWSLVALPGSDFASPRTYTVALEGERGLAAHLPTYVVVDAAVPTAVERLTAPWYLQAIALSGPLHFGDYGGLPLKVLWAGFTAVTLGLSVTGVWTFFSSRRRRPRSAPALEPRVAT